MSDEESMDAGTDGCGLYARVVVERIPRKRSELVLHVLGAVVHD